MLIRTSITELLPALRNDDRGTIAVIFALSFLPLAMFAGGALDVTRMYAYHDKLQGIADQALATALQGDRSTPVATRIAAARKTVESFGQDGKAIEPDIDIRQVDRVVQAKITLRSSIDLAFGRLFRMETANVVATSSREKNFGSIDNRLILCHIGKPEDIKRLDCGTRS